MKFTIKRSLRSKPATCEIDIFNMSGDNRKTIQTARRPVVQVAAGYKDAGVSTIFNGIGSKVTVFRDKTDSVTRVRAGDGHIAYRTARTNRSFAANAELTDVINALANDIGVGTGNVSTATSGVTLDQLGSTYAHGTVLHGNACRAMTHLLRSCGLEWSIQDGILQILQRGGHLQQQAVTLSSDTGLLDVPEIGNHNVVTCKALIQPDLVPGRLVSLQSNTVNGTYRIEDVEFTGDSIGEEWTEELTLRTVS